MQKKKTAIIKNKILGDHIHCCPKDHTCDTKEGHCKRKIDQLNEVQCPDGIFLILFNFIFN